MQPYPVKNEVFLNIMAGNNYVLVLFNGFKNILYVNIKTQGQKGGVMAKQALLPCQRVTMATASRARRMRVLCSVCRGRHLVASEGLKVLYERIASF